MKKHTKPKAAVVLNGRPWCQKIAAKGAALVADALGPSTVIIKNVGDCGVRFFAEHGDHVDVLPGHVRASYAHGIVRVENHNASEAFVEFDILPVTLKR